MNRQLRIKILEKFDRQRGFADAIDVCESVVSDIIHGRRRIPENHIEAWCAALKCSADELRDLGAISS